MRLALNLASQPYENAREFYTRWITYLVLALVVTGGLVWMAIAGWRQSRKDNAYITNTREQIALLQKEAAAAQTILDQPPNKDVAQQSAYINELILRKSLSWTQVFADLEKMMPAELRVIQMQPVFDNESRLELRMTIEGGSRDKVLQLLRRMEDSPRFSDPGLRAEVHPEGPGAGGMQFQLATYYVPQAPAPKETPKPDASGGQP